MDKQTKIQKDITDKTLKFFETERFGYIDGAMRLGKMKITIDFLKQYPKTFGEILLCYPDNKLKEGWENEFIKWNYTNPYITFVNFSSLKKHKDYIFDLLIVDEFHSCSPLEKDYCHQIMTNGSKTLCLGLSGTISKETKGEWGLKEIAKYTTLEGIDDGILADYQITVHFVDLDNKIKTPNKKGKLLTEKQKYDNFSFVIEKFRNEGKDTMYLLLSRNRLSTSSIGKLNYTKNLLQKLRDRRVVVFAGLTETADAIGIPSYHNKSKSDSNFQDFQNKKINHLALANMGKLGVSYTDLDCVILLNATGNKEETAQICNRAIKLDYHNKIADIHIIALRENAEKVKITKTLSMLNKNKIKYENQKN